MLIEDFFSKQELMLENKTLVVATSGGPDSMALLDMCNSLQAQYHLHIIAAHLNHQLRPSAIRENQVIVQYCHKKPIKIINQSWPIALHPETGLEAAAREYRYHFLLDVMEQNSADYLLTAHHCDDLLENILLKFIRSGNPSEMNSLQAVTKMGNRTLLRPFLTVEKATILAYVQEQHIPYVIDETNNKDDVLRNRIRHHIVPLLKKENPQIGQNALRFSEHVSLMNSLINQAFTQIGPPEKFLDIAYRLKTDRLKFLSKQQQIVYWQYFIWQTFHVRVNEHLKDFNLVTYQGYFYLYQSKLPLPEKTKPVIVGQKFAYNKRHLLVTKNRSDVGTLVGQFSAPTHANLQVGSLTPGTKLRLPNGQHVKSKKKFAANAIPNALRPYCLAIFANENVALIEKTYSWQNNLANQQEYYLYDNI